MIYQSYPINPKMIRFNGRWHSTAMVNLPARSKWRLLGTGCARWSPAARGQSSGRVIRVVALADAVWRRVDRNMQSNRGNGDDVAAVECSFDLAQPMASWKKKRPARRHPGHVMSFMPAVGRTCVIEIDTPLRLFGGSGRPHSPGRDGEGRANGAEHACAAHEVRKGTLQMDSRA